MMMTNWLAVVLASICALATALGSPVRAAEGDGSFTPLFDGKTLAGWTPTPGGRWEVSDGVIVGTSPKTEPRHGILLTNERYGDFVLKAKFRVLKGDSGLYFRVDKVKGAVGVHGFQVEVDTTNETGGLYETGGRAWVAMPTDKVIKERNYKPGEWTDLEIDAHGGDVTVKINGVVSAQLEDDKGRREGHIGLQLHGGQEMHVEFKDIIIQTSKGN